MSLLLLRAQVEKDVFFGGYTFPAEEKRKEKASKPSEGKSATVKGGGRRCLLLPKASCSFLSKGKEGEEPGGKIRKVVGGQERMQKTRGYVPPKKEKKGIGRRDAKVEKAVSLLQGEVPALREKRGKSVKSGSNPLTGSPFPLYRGTFPF